MKPFKMFFFLLLAVMLSGCAGYRAGRSLPNSVQTVSLSVVNETAEPAIEVAVMKALRAELQRDGRLKVDLKEEADAHLTVTLTDYHLTPLAYDRRRGLLAREYRITVNARTVLTDADSGNVILENPGLAGESDFVFDTDLTTAKLGALSSAAADLARKTVSLTLFPW